MTYLILTGFPPCFAGVSFDTLRTAFSAAIFISGVAFLLSNAFTSMILPFSSIIKEKNTTLKVNDSIKLKGRFIGYDDLLGEFKMDECSIVE